MENRDKNYNLTSDSNHEVLSAGVNVFYDKNITDGEHSAHYYDHHSAYHHSSHHNSGHHHHSRSHHRRSTKKKKLTITTKTGWIMVLSISLLLLVIAAAVIMMEEKQPGFTEQQINENSADILMVEVNNSEGLLVKDAVNKYLLTDLLNPATANILLSSFANGDGRLDVQVPVSLKLSVKEGYALSYKIELANNDSFNNAEIYYVEASSGICEFKHLYTNTTYYYRVTVHTSRGTDSVVGHFKTADTPRILSIDGLSNVRDIGNWRTDSGKRVKQGLLIRGTEMDAAVESEYHLTNAGLVDMLDIFEIKTDMDLRAKIFTSKDALGARVEHKYYNMVMYDDIFTDEGKEKVRMVFVDLANPDNYPIYLHCTYGCDRTGTICYLLEALLGVSRGDCLKEYSLSNLESVKIKVVEEGLKAYKGDTLKEQVESYLLSCDISEYQINSIRSILLGE